MTDVSGIKEEQCILLSTVILFATLFKKVNCYLLTNSLFCLVRCLGSVIHFIKILHKQLFTSKDLPTYPKPVWFLSTCEKLYMRTTEMCC